MSSKHNFKTNIYFLKVNLSLWRKYNEYRPYLFNSTLDFCKIMAIKNRKISFDRMFFDAIRQSSNINHTCPFKVSLNDRFYTLHT